MQSLIYVSTSCVNAEKIEDAVAILAANGFQNIELTGGHPYNPDYLEKLLNLKEEYDLNYLCHNYFPPPPKPFALNLASLDDAIHEESIKLVKNAISLSKLFAASKLGVHSGFFCDPESCELGGSWSNRVLSEKNKAIDKFVVSWRFLSELSMQNNLTLYIENNVLNSLNHKVFGGDNPLMLTTLKDFIEFRNLFEFELLFDMAHYKVSANTMKEDFKTGFAIMAESSSYWHVSDNDGVCDQNRILSVDSDILELISDLKTSPEVVTLEAKGSLSEITENHECLMKIFESKRGK